MTNMNDINQRLAQEGWKMECESPLELRHIASGSFASGLAADIVVQALPEFDNPIQVYQDSSTEPPRIAGWPMNQTLYEAYLDQDILVTFLAMVPLDILVHGGADGLAEYCQQAFGEFAEMSDTEFRAVPAASASDSWDERFDGDVAIQVTCSLHSPD